MLQKKAPKDIKVSFKFIINKIEEDDNLISFFFLKTEVSGIKYRYNVELIKTGTDHNRWLHFLESEIKEGIRLDQMSFKSFTDLKNEPYRKKTIETNVTNQIYN